MFIVNQGYELTLGGETFKPGKTLPPNRDYSALITLGWVSETIAPPPPKNYEPSIVKIQRDKRNGIKKEQAKAKSKRVAAKKKKPATPKKAKPKKFTVEGGG